MKIYKYIIALVVIGVAILLGIWYDNGKQVAGASIIQGQGYYSTTTPTYATSTNGVVLLTPLRADQGGITGILGSVIFPGGPNSGSCFLSDATTSNSTLRTNQTSSSSIFIIGWPAGEASSTIVLDRIYNNGLLLTCQGNPSTTTITWKYN